MARRLWTEDEVTHEGRHFRLSKAVLTLKPMQRPHPPVWIAASGDPAVERAARLGDAWLIIGAPEECRADIERHARALGVGHFIFRVQWPGMPQEDSLKQIAQLGRQIVASSELRH